MSDKNHPKKGNYPMPDQKLNIVGHSVKKVDAYGLAAGAPVFAADILPADCLYMAMVFSPHAHARILNIDASGAMAMDGVVAVYTHKDVPRVVHTTAGQGYPEPSPYDTCMLDNKVRFVGDRVAAIVATDRQVAREAVKRVKVEYEVLPAVFDPREALKPGAPVIHDEPEARMPIPVTYDPKRNLAAEIEANVGDVEQANADVVVDGYFYHHQYQHCPIEPHVCLAWPDPNGRLFIKTSTQVPFHVRRIVAARLRIPIHRIRVIKPRIGGGFGVKQEILLEDIAGFAALDMKRPVLFEYNRTEELRSSRTRHAMYIRLRAGAKKNGDLSFIDMDAVMNTGAYGSHGLTVLSNTGSKTLPLYRWPNIRFHGRTAYTNLPVAGAYRGYGGTQGDFAMEVGMDELAGKLGMDPVEFRRRNHIRVGETSPIFEALGEGKAGVPQVVNSCGLDACLKQGAAAFGWDKPIENRVDGAIRRGRGMVTLMQGSAIPDIDMGSASIKMNDDGSFNLLVGATDIGTGSDTVMAQIAAEVLHVPVNKIIVYSSDTDLTPFDVGAYASSTTYLSGMAVKKTAQKMRDQILDVAAGLLNTPCKDLRLSESSVNAPNGKSVSLERIGLYTLYEKDQRQLIATASHIVHQSPPPFAAHFAQVAVDTETGNIKVERYVAAVDCGQAINPALAEGQIEGALVNGLSAALYEELLYNANGALKNKDFDTYKIMGTMDLPEIKTILVTTHEPTGPFGAKSVSEICINGPMPIISNAVYDAVGIRLREAPFTPQKVLALLRDKGI